MFVVLFFLLLLFFFGGGGVVYFSREPERNKVSMSCHFGPLTGGSEVNYFRD